MSAVTVSTQAFGRAPSFRTPVGCLGDALMPHIVTA